MLKNIFSKFKKNVNKKNEGFTLIEALVSIALILIAVIGPLTLTMNAITSIIQNKNRVIASYLAEEIVEDFRNYRDDFALTCGNIDFSYSADYSTINSASCSGNTSVQVLSYIGTTDPTLAPNVNPRDIAWKVFLASVFNTTNPGNKPLTPLYLDNSSFNEGSLSFVGSTKSCINLYLDSIVGYNCNGSGNSTLFQRTTTLTKISDDTLKVEVNVVYTNSSLSGIGQRSVSVVDYIYKR
ncbi:MAG: prepilin-type N-terminal cleavage/methylation domain-containing protein [Candidatus Nomurabacteria bacterium]